MAKEAIFIGINIPLNDYLRGEKYEDLKNFMELDCEMSITKERPSVFDPKFVTFRKGESTKFIYFVWEMRTNIKKVTPQYLQRLSSVDIRKDGPPCCVNWIPCDNRILYIRKFMGRKDHSVDITSFSLYKVNYDEMTIFDC
jgi:hypothetical protein